MGQIKVPTNFNLDIEFEVPEFFRRFFSWCIDLFIQITYIIICIKIIDTTGIPVLNQGFFTVLVSITLLFPVIFYYLLFEIFTNGQSIGKKLTGLRVVNENGGKASYSQFIIRWLIRVSDNMIFVLIFILLASSEDAFRNPEARWTIVIIMVMMITDVFLVASSKKGQRLGDLLARTIIVRTRTKANINETVFLEVDSSYIPSYPQIMQLSDKDINAIKSILDIAKKNGDFQLATMAADKIKNHLHIQSDLGPFDFLSTALKDYNYLSTK